MSCLRRSPRVALRSLASLTLTAALLPVFAACAARGAQDPSPTPAPTPSSRVDTPTNTSQPITRWPVRTAQHVDLWLHAFALISRDTATVPLYRRAYRDSVSAVRRAANVLTSLDANRDSLAAGLARSPAYLGAQFLPLEYGSWEEMRVAIDRFLQFQGNPQRAPDAATAERIAGLAAVFATPADREWLRLFSAAVQDEQTRWFAATHARQVQARSDVVGSVDSLWQTTYRAKLSRFLANTAQRSGDLLLSLPLGGEGRTGAGRERQTIVAVTWPGRSADAREAILVFAHEITGSLAGSVVTDNTSPAEKRDGLADRYIALAQTRAGAMLLQQAAPELVDAYMRYYLAQSGVAAGGNVMATFERTYSLPKGITDGLLRQIEIVLGGI